MSSSLLDAGPYPSAPVIPFKLAPISPSDHVELVDCIGLWIVDDGSKGNLTVRWHDGKLTTLDLTDATLAHQAGIIPCLPAFVQSTDTDYGDGDIIGAFLGANTTVANRSPFFRNDSFERTVAADQATLEGLFTADVFDPDYDALTWTEEGTWPTPFTLQTTGANAGRIDYARSGDLTVGDIELEVGVVDAAGVNTKVTATFTLHVTAA